MLGQFDPNWLPTLARALTGFTGLAFCQQSEVKCRQGRDEYYTELRGKVRRMYSPCRLYNYRIKGKAPGLHQSTLPRADHKKTWVIHSAKCVKI